MPLIFWLETNWYKTMKCIWTIREEIFPTEEQKQKILQTLGCCRFIYNYMLSRNRKAYGRRKARSVISFCGFYRKNFKQQVFADELDFRASGGYNFCWYGYSYNREFIIFLQTNSKSWTIYAREIETCAMIIARKEIL